MSDIKDMDLEAMPTSILLNDDDDDNPDHKILILNVTRTIAPLKLQTSQKHPRNFR